MIRTQRRKIRTICLYISTLIVFLASLQCGHTEARDAASRKRRTQRLFAHFERKSLRKGWQKITVTVNGLERKLLWKGPKSRWTNGAIIAVHGGGGTYSNFIANIRLGKPMVEFGELALASGFAVFCPDSTDGVVTCRDGSSAGKRWDSMAREDRPNIDLPFFETIITKTIPGLRPQDSAKNIFITGISNGGFMTILVTTHLGGRITAFAPVACGDPYGTYMQCNIQTDKRPTAPGVFRDSETNKLISETDAAVASSYSNEKKWPITNAVTKPPFKQFHHQGDGVAEISLMEKARRQLIKNGYKDDGPFILKHTGKRTAFKHLWMTEYNRPMIEFFKKHVSK